MPPPPGTHCVRSVIFTFAQPRIPGLNPALPLASCMTLNQVFSLCLSLLACNMGIILLIIVPNSRGC